MSQPLPGLRTALCPEAHLIVCCARTQLDDVHSQRISRLLQGNIDWCSLLEMAFRHKLTALVHRHVESVASAEIPEAVRAALKEQIHRDIQSTLYLTKELLRLLAWFGQAGIAALPYKGPVLASSVYGDLGLRPFDDLDLLVHEQDVLPAMQVLVANGYEIIRPRQIARVEEQLQAAAVARLLPTSLSAYQLVLWHPDRRTTVELHWRVVPKFIFPRDSQPLWENPVTVRIAGVDVPSFTPENLLWYLCVHGAKHEWRRLNWLCDLAELIRVHPDLNWDQLVLRAATFGVERRLYLGLCLAHALLQARVPAPVAAKAYSAPHIPFLARQAVDLIFRSDEEAAGASSFRHAAFQLRTMDRWADRGTYVLRLIKGNETALTAPETLERPSTFFSVVSHLIRAYLIRPLRLLTTYGLGPFLGLLKGGVVSLLGLDGDESRDMMPHDHLTKDHAKIS